MSDDRLREAFDKIEREYQLVKRAVDKHGRAECDRILQPKGRAGWVSRAALEALAGE